MVARGEGKEGVRIGYGGEGVGGISSCSAVQRSAAILQLRRSSYAAAAGPSR